MVAKKYVFYVKICDVPGGIRGLHVQQVVFIDQQFIGKRKIITVGIDPAGVEWLNDDLLAQMPEDFLSR